MLKKTLAIRLLMDSFNAHIAITEVFYRTLKGRLMPNDSDV